MNCIFCDANIPDGRAEFLTENNMAQICKDCAEGYVGKKKFVDFGEDGVDTVLCDNVEDRSLASIFADESEESGDEE